MALIIFLLVRMLGAHDIEYEAPGITYYWLDMPMPGGFWVIHKVYHFIDFHRERPCACVPVEFLFEHMLYIICCNGNVLDLCSGYVLRQFRALALVLYESLFQSIIVCWCWLWYALIYFIFFLVGAEWWLASDGL